MKVSELSEYKETTEKTGIKVGDRVRKIIDSSEYIIARVDSNTYAAIGLDRGIFWQGPIKIGKAANRNFTKSELEQILGSLNDWEVVDG